MINRLGNLLSFADVNVSSDNNSYNINNRSYDDSFAKMLNKTQEDISNKIIEHCSDSDINNYNNLEDYSNIPEEKISEISGKEEEAKDKKTDDNLKKSEINEDAEKKQISKDNLVSDDNNQSSEDNTEKADNISSENIPLKEKRTSVKAKLKEKLIIKNNENNKKSDNTRNNEIKEADIKKNALHKKDNIKNTEEIENIKKQIDSLDLKDEDHKEELEELIESLENIKSIMEKSNINNDKLNSNENEENIKETDHNNLKVKDIDSSESKEIKIESNKENNKNTEAEDIINKSYSSFTEDVQINITDTEIKYTDKNDKNTLEIKNGAGSINNTISDEKGAELTIINMKDSAEGANLKGYNHYNNNVSKTQNGANISDSMIKFQDLMGKLAEKAQVAVSNGKSEVLMSLNPEYLGKIRLKISMDGDNLIGKIFVDNADVKDIFAKNLDTVITSLNEIGVNIEGFDIMLKQDMPNNEGEFQNFERGFGFENNGSNIEEVKTDIKAYIIPERKLNLLI